MIIAIDCGEPPRVKHAIANYTKTTYNCDAWYKCMSDHYYLVEEQGTLSDLNDISSGITQTSRVSCQENGRWQEKSLKCIGLYSILFYSFFIYINAFKKINNY